MGPIKQFVRYYSGDNAVLNLHVEINEVLNAPLKYLKYLEISMKAAVNKK